MGADIGLDTTITLLMAWAVFLLALGLRLWKEEKKTTSENQNHPYIDTAQRAAVSYSFAILLLAIFAELSDWPTWVNLIAVITAVFPFVAAIISYVAHGTARNTTNQTAHYPRILRIRMSLLAVGAITGFAVLVSGFIATQLI